MANSSHASPPQDIITETNINLTLALRGTNICLSYYEREGIVGSSIHLIPRYQGEALTPHLVGSLLLSDFEGLLPKDVSTERSRTEFSLIPSVYDMAKYSRHRCRQIEVHEPFFVARLIGATRGAVIVLNETQYVLPLQLVDCRALCIVQGHAMRITKDSESVFIHGIVPEEDMYHLQK